MADAPSHSVLLCSLSKEGTASLTRRAHKVVTVTLVENWALKVVLVHGATVVPHPVSKLVSLILETAERDDFKTASNVSTRRGL